LPSDPIERIRERFPDTGVAWLRLETQEVAITQLQSGELRAGAVKAGRPRAARVGGMEPGATTTRASRFAMSPRLWLLETPQDLRTPINAING
jgi:hypothetical protein